MRARWLLVTIVSALACGASTEEPSRASDVEEWIIHDTGRPCAPARVACERGNCAANVQNTCDTPVTCDLYIECICAAYTGEEGPATATSGKNTILAGEKDGLAARVLCSSGEVVATIARRVVCI
jgi:hypothetical protein